MKDYIAAYNRRDEIKQQQDDEKKSKPVNFERGIYQEINKIKSQARKIIDKLNHDSKDAIEYRNNEKTKEFLKYELIIDDIYIYIFR